MDQQTEFSLDNAARIWLDQLRQSGHFSSDDLDELKAHLLDSVDDLKTNGLSEEEAFLIASRRLGPVEVLGKEFGKLGRTWVLQRESVLLAFGAVAFIIFQNFVEIVLGSAFIRISGRFGLRPPTEFYFTWFCVLFFVAVACIIFAVIQTAPRWLPRLFALLQRAPALVVCGLGILLLVTGFMSFDTESPLRIYSDTKDYPNLNIGESEEVYYWFWVCFYLVHVLALFNVTIRHTTSSNTIRWLSKAPAGWLVLGGLGTFLLTLGLGIEVVRVWAPVEGMARFQISAGIACFLIGWALSGSPRYSLLMRLVIAIAPTVFWYGVAVASAIFFREHKSYLLTEGFPFTFFGAAIGGAIAGQALGILLNKKPQRVAEF